MATPTCWSWDGQPCHLAREARYTCSDHAAEEDAISRQVDDLARVATALAKCAEPGRSTNEKRDLSEGAAARFFTTALGGTGFEVVTGHRAPENSDSQKGTELDLVVDARAKNPEHFGERSRHNIESAPVHAHLEVSYYSNFDARKIKDDLTRLDRTIRDAHASRLKTWTGLAYLGPVDPDQFEEIRGCLVAHYHGHELHPRATSNVGTSWPVVDAVIVPGRIWKKHEYSRAASVTSEVLVGYHEIPTFTSDPLRLVRPLSVARHFLSNFLRLEREEAIDVLNTDRGAVLGPRVGETRRPAIVVLPCRDLPVVYRDGTALPWIPHVPPFDGRLCAGGKRHVYVAAEG